MYFIAGYFHDLGKSGECKEVAVYKVMDSTLPKMSVCSFVTQPQNDGSSQIVGMKYYDIPEHPEKGYEFLKGYKTYKKFTLIGTESIESYRNNAISVYFEDWEEMFDHMDLDSYTKRLVRIATGAHWYFGDSIRKIVERGGEEADFIELTGKFIRDVELFHNDEFFDLDKDRLNTVLIFVIIISVADIIGSEYNPSL